MSRYYCSFGICNSSAIPGRPGYDPRTRFFSFPQPCLELRDHVLEWDRNDERRHIPKCSKCSLCWDWMVRCRREDEKFSSIRRMTHNYRICSKHFPQIEGKIDHHVHKPSSNPPKEKISKYRRVYCAPEPSTSQTNGLSESNHGPSEGSSDPNPMDAQTTQPSFSTSRSTGLPRFYSEVACGVEEGQSDYGPTLEEVAAIAVTPTANTSVTSVNDIMDAEGVLEKVPSGNIVFELPNDDLFDIQLTSPIREPTMTSSGFAGTGSAEGSESVGTSSFFAEPTMVTTSTMTTPAQQARMVDVGTQTSWLFSEAQSKDHSTQTRWSFPDAQGLMVKFRQLQLMNKRLETKIKELQRMAAFTEFETRLTNSDKMCKFYTSLNNAQLKALQNFCNRDDINYWGRETGNRKKRERKLTVNQELLLFFLRFRGGLLVNDIAYRFNVSISCVSRVVTTFIQYLYMKFDTIRAEMFPSRHHIKDMLPPRFRSMKNIRIIIDCAEIFCEKPTNFEQQGNCYSEYKAHTTHKVLLGCTPYGAVCFVSDLFEGSMSDRAIVEQSGITELLEEGDLVLADRGFTVKDLLDQRGVAINIPAFLKGRDRLTPQEELATKEIAANRIFVEHTVKRLKDFRFFRKVVPQNMRHVLSQAVFVCACLQNFLDPQIT